MLTIGEMSQWVLFMHTMCAAIAVSTFHRIWNIVIIVGSHQTEISKRLVETGMWGWMTQGILNLYPLSFQK